MYTYSYKHMWSWSINVCIHIDIPVNMDAYNHIYIHICICIYIHVNVCSISDIHLYIPGCTYMNIWGYICLYICILSTYEHTARKASWNPAGVEPVLWKSADIKLSSFKLVKIRKYLSSELMVHIKQVKEGIRGRNPVYKRLVGRCMYIFWFMTIWRCIYPFWIYEDSYIYFEDIQIYFDMCLVTALVWG